MLSDEQMDRKIRGHVKAHPVILPEDYQTMVQEQIRTCCEEEVQMNTSVKKQRKKRIAAAACIVLCIGVCGAGGVRAGMNYAKQRVSRRRRKNRNLSGRMLPKQMRIHFPENYLKRSRSA